MHFHPPVTVKWLCVKGSWGASGVSPHCGSKIKSCLPRSVGRYAVAPAGTGRGPTCGGPRPARPASPSPRAPPRGVTSPGPPRTQPPHGRRLRQPRLARQLPPPSTTPRSPDLWDVTARNAPKLPTAGVSVNPRHRPAVTAVHRTATHPACGKSRFAAHPDSPQRASRQPAPPFSRHRRSPPRDPPDLWEVTARSAPNLPTAGVSVNPGSPVNRHRRPPPRDPPDLWEVTVRNAPELPTAGVFVDPLAPQRSPSPFTSPRYARSVGRCGSERIPTPHGGRLR
jgi:hypothetical protein